MDTSPAVCHAVPAVAGPLLDFACDVHEPLTPQRFLCRSLRPGSLALAPLAALKCWPPLAASSGQVTIRRQAQADRMKVAFDAAFGTRGIK